MKRVLLAPLLLLFTLLPAASAASGVQLVEAGSASFPDRAFALTTATPVHLDANTVQVRENGQPVANVILQPAQTADVGKFGVVLVLDSSWSMRGEPIARALDAAGVFADKRAPNEQLGVVTFNRTVQTLLSPTTDPASISTAIKTSPPLAVGTHIYDAVGAAISLLRNSHAAVRSLVLLSDGADTGSKARLSAVLAAARTQHVRIFAVGLRSKQFQASTLQHLANGTQGAYSEASSPAALAPIYQSLSSQLSNEYLLQYKSLAGPGALVHVAVRILGVPGVASASYQTPALPTRSAPPYHRSALSRFWLSAGSAVVVALIVGLLVALALVALVRSRPTSLSQRIVAFTPFVQQIREKRVTESQTVVALEQRLSRTQWWSKLASEIEIADFPVRPMRLFLLTTAASVLLAFIVAIALPPIFIVLGLAAPPFVARSLVARKLRQRREKFADQLPDNLNVLAAALRVGHSFIGALSVMVNEAEEPAKSEFRRAIADEQLGVPIEDALVVTADRMESGDLEQIALVASLQRQTGGNTAEVLDTVVETIRERAEIRRLVRTLTTQGRAARWILSVLPLALFCLIALINPGYLHPLFHRTAGQFLLTLAVVLVVTGSMAISRIVNIKV